jgi:hypothetical protein
MQFDRDRRIKLAERRNTTLIFREPSIEGRYFTAAAARKQYITKISTPFIKNSHSFPFNNRNIYHEGVPICKAFNKDYGCN